MARLKRKRLRRRAPFRSYTLPRINKKRLAVIALFASLIYISLAFGRYLSAVSGEMAAKEAKDIVVLRINEAIGNMISEGSFEYGGFVHVEKDAAGNVTAITTDTARVNALSADLLREVVGTLGQRELDLGVPVGTLSGMQLLQGRGPKIPVRIHMLTASYAQFKSELSSAGINQTRHQIILEVDVQINILIPWKTLTEDVATQVLVAETVIVGRVPDTVIEWGGTA
jgi:sporulation protein YunB